MKSALVKREDLLEILKQNREAHVANFKQAKQARLVRLREYCAMIVEAIDSNPTKQPKFEQHFPIPVSHEEDYHRAITMLEMDTRSEIELSQGEFDQLVLDKWHWTNDVLRTQTIYGMGADHP